MPSSTLGFETARHVGSRVDREPDGGRAHDRPLVSGVTMGRPTGHLTLGIGKAVSATCTIIPEEFRGGPICSPRSPTSSRA